MIYFNSSILFFFSLFYLFPLFFFFFIPFLYFLYSLHIRLAVGLYYHILPLSYPSACKGLHCSDQATPIDFCSDHCCRSSPSRCRSYLDGWSALSLLLVWQIGGLNNIQTSPIDNRTFQLCPTLDSPSK